MFCVFHGGYIVRHNCLPKKRGGGVVAEGYIINIMVFSDVLFWLVILSIVSVYHFKVFVCPRSGPCCSG